MKIKIMMTMMMMGIATLMSACNAGTPGENIGGEGNIIVDPPPFGGGCVLERIPDAKTLVISMGEKEMAVQGGDAVNESMRAFLIRRLQKVAYNMKESCVAKNDGGDVTSAPAVASADHTSTGTNLQDAEVGEWDSMQTDGTYLYALTGNIVYISQVYPIADAKTLAQFKVDGLARGIALSGKTLSVVSDVTPSLASNFKNSVAISSATHTQVTMIDVTDPAKPKVNGQRLFAGTWISGRHHDGQLYLVLKSNIPQAPQYLAVSTPCGADGKPADQRTWEATLSDELEKQSDVIRKMDFVSKITDDVNAEDSTQFYANTEVSGVNFMRIIQVDIADASAQKVMITGGGSVVYASKKSIYVADTVFAGNTTAIHRFSTEDRLAYSGTVVPSGSVLNSFSMGEDDGVMRVATTLQFGASNTIHTFRLGSDTMAPLGKLEGIAPGESIYAVRYIGKRGYVVTFRQTDPLFVVDFENPSAPKMLGELQIPGYSTYLHALGDAHLIGVGMSGAMTPKISLFDISDASHPKEKAVSELNAYKSSALTDHHAFTFDAVTGFLALPSSGGYRLFQVNADKGIAQVGKTSVNPGSPWIAEDESRAIIMSDSNGTRLVTIGSKGVQIRKTDATLSVEKSLWYMPN